MKNTFRISGVILLILTIFLIQSCKKDKPTPPVITTVAVTQISYTTATSGGDAIDEGGAPIIAKGVCWNTSAEPTIANSMTIESGGLGAFTSNITLLTSNTLYYVRAYATNSAGTGYGNQMTFTTSQVAVPVLTTTEITSITQTTAVSGGNITDDNGGSVTARGVCWGTATNPTTADSKTTDGTGTFVSNLTDLLPGTIYYVRAYATNSAGTAYGNEISLITQPPGIPVLTTINITNITGNSATSGGDVTSYDGTFLTVCGVCWSTIPNPTISDNKTTNGPERGFLSSITGLTRNTAYFVRAYATNTAGTFYGNELSFKTALLSIGDSYQGGKVAYILQPRDPGYDSNILHGLIAAPSDLGSAQWGCFGTLISGADGYEIGTGNQNTIDIIAGCSTLGIAARLCSDLVLDGYSDWYLPSSRELNFILGNMTIIGGFTNNLYWSSTEYNSYYGALDKYSGWQNGSKSDLALVRAIRTF